MAETKQVGDGSLATGEFRLWAKEIERTIGILIETVQDQREWIDSNRQRIERLESHLAAVVTWLGGKGTSVGGIGPVELPDWPTPKPNANAGQ